MNDLLKFLSSLTIDSGDCTCSGCVKRHKTIILTGTAFDAARALEAVRDAETAQVAALEEQIKQVRELARSDAKALWASIEAETGTEGVKGLSIDTDYLAEHSLAFLKVPVTETAETADLKGADISETAEEPAETAGI